MIMCWEVVMAKAVRLAVWQGSRWAAAAGPGSCMSSAEVGRCFVCPVSDGESDAAGAFDVWWDDHAAHTTRISIAIGHQVCNRTFKTRSAGHGTPAASPDHASYFLQVDWMKLRRCVGASERGHPAGFRELAECSWNKPGGCGADSMESCAGQSKEWSAAGEHAHWQLTGGRCNTAAGCQTTKMHGERCVGEQCQAPAGKLAPSPQKGN